MDVGANAHIGPLTSDIERTKRVDVGIDPYNVVIGAVGGTTHRSSPTLISFFDLLFVLGLFQQGQIPPFVCIFSTHSLFPIKSQIIR